MYPDKQQLLESIRFHSGKQMNKAFFLKIYGYEISFPGFAEEAIKALNDAGCSRAREYYNVAVAEYRRKQDEELKPVARELHRKWERDWEKLVKEGEEKRRQEIQSLTKEELTELCQKLLQEGVIERPEQFATAVLHVH